MCYCTKRTAIYGFFYSYCCIKLSLFFYGQITDSLNRNRLVLSGYDNKRYMCWYSYNIICIIWYGYHSILLCTMYQLHMHVLHINIDWICARYCMSGTPYFWYWSSAVYGTGSISKIWCNTNAISHLFHGLRRINCKNSLIHIFNHWI